MNSKRELLCQSPKRELDEARYKRIGLRGGRIEGETTRRAPLLAASPVIDCAA